MVYHLVNKTADYSNNIASILVAKINYKKVCEKMEINSMLEKVLLVCNRYAKLLRLEGATCGSFRRIRKKNRIILKSLQRKS